VARGRASYIEMTEIKRTHAILAVAIAAVIVYANSIANGFAYDDLWIILRNDRVHQLRDLSKIWLTPYWPSFGSELGLYRPFAIFAFALEWAVGGGAPWFFHLVNVLLHALVSVMVFVLIEKLFSRTAAFAGALVFAVHPLHTEAVANVVGQNELWAALGVLGACLVYISRPEGLALQPKRTAAILALYAVSLLAKESAVVLPGLLVLLDFVQQRAQGDRPGLMRYARSILPLVIGSTLVLGAYLLLRHSVLGNLAGTDAAPGLPYLREEYRLLNAFRAWPEFVRLLFFPLDLTVDYAPGVVLPVESFTPMVLLGMLLVFVVVLLALSTPRAPRAGIVAGWFLITILPVANFFFPIGVLIAERTLYMPSLAVCFMAGFAWEAAVKSVERETRRLALAAGLAILAFFGIRTAIRNPDWDSLQSVWRSLSRDHPESYRSQWLNAIGMWNQGRPDLAEKYFEIAYKIWPRDSQMLAEWGNFYIGQRRYDKAIPLLEQARDMTPFVPRTHEFLAYAYLYAGRPQEALETALHAHQMASSHPSINLPTIAGAHEQLGQHEQAADAWAETVKLKSGNLWLNWAMLARAQARAGRREEALRSADVALNKTNNEPKSTEAVRKLKTAINGNCYSGADQACDPLLGWQVAIGTPAAGAR
jgi:protein O-mannosyl-transferase